MQNNRYHTCAWIPGILSNAFSGQDLRPVVFDGSMVLTVTESGSKRRQKRLIVDLGVLNTYDSETIARYFDDIDVVGQLESVPGIVQIISERRFAA